MFVDFQTKVLLGMAITVGVAFVALVIWVLFIPDEKRNPNRWKK